MFCDFCYMIELFSNYKCNDVEKNGRPDPLLKDSTELRGCHFCCMCPPPSSPLLPWPKPWFGEQDSTGANFLGRGCDKALFSEKKGVFQWKGGRDSVNEGFGKDFLQER